MPLGKERAQRAVDQPRQQNRLLAGPAFATEEAARDAAGRIELLLEFHGHGKEVDPWPHILAHGGRSQQDGVTVPNGDCAASLRRKQPRLNAEDAAADFHAVDVGSLKKLHNTCLFDGWQANRMVF
jgi:hypothetical protein